MKLLSGVNKLNVTHLRRQLSETWIFDCRVCFSAPAQNAVAWVLPNEIVVVWRVWRGKKGLWAQGMKHSHMTPLQWQTPFCYQTKHKTNEADWLNKVKIDTESCYGSCLWGDIGTNWKGQITRFCGKDPAKCQRVTVNYTKFEWKEKKRSTDLLYNFW